MSQYRKLAQNIVRQVGGEKNINSLVHCATRLRFQLKDNSKADKKAIESMQGVLSVVLGGGQFQVVIGTHVSKVYEEILAIANISKATDEEMPKAKLVDRVFNTISRSFGPLLGAMAGAGMLKALLAVLIKMGIMTGAESTYVVLMGAANAVFYFLPIFLGITISINLGANPYVGGAIGAALLEPSIAALSAAEMAPNIFGIPLVMIDYSSTVFPIFIAMAIFAPFERKLKKIIPINVQLFLVPLISLIVLVPLTLLVFGPFGTNVGNAIGEGIKFLSSKSGLLTGAVMGAAWMPLTVLGLHWGLVPILMHNLSNGGDPIIAMASSAVFAQLGVALSLVIKSKKKEERALAMTTFVTGALSGVTEPIIYGFLTKYKRTLPYVIVAGAIGGAINGAAGTKGMAFAFPSFMAIPVFDPMLIFVIGVMVAFCLAFAAVFLLGYEDKNAQPEDETANEVDEKEPMKTGSKEEIYSPMKGALQVLKNVEDDVFASGAMGRGIAIQPSEGKVYAPFDGTISVMFPTGHAIGLASENGTELLIHVGINTVQLEGNHFQPKVAQGQKVKRGDLLMEFEIEEIKRAGYAITTPVIVTNSDSYTDVISKETMDADITLEETILTVIG